MMSMRRSALAAVRQASRRTPMNLRTFSVSVRQSKDTGHDLKFPDTTGIKGLADIKTEEDLLPPGAPPGTVPDDLNQSTGLERLEILAKMEGIDIWDMKPLDASRLGTMEDPIIVTAGGEEQYVGCTGYPVDSHWVRWLTVSRKRPIERCDQCGNVIKLRVGGPGLVEHSEHDDHHHHAEPADPESFADFVKPEYYYK